MSRLDALPPDQRATLSLLLRRRKSYADVAAMLDIEERAVHDRAHAALAVLAARQARELSAAQRDEVGDYLLGQRAPAAEQRATRTYLEGSPQARAWAHAVTAELAPLAGGTPLPEIPPGGQAQPASQGTARAPAPARASPTPLLSDGGDSGDAGASPPRPARQPPSSRAQGPRSSAPSSRVGGALLLAAIVAVIVVAVVLIANSGGGGSHSAGSTAAAGSETETGTSSGTTSSATQTGKAKEDKRITLSSPDAASTSAGVAEVLSEGSQYAIYLAAQHLPPSKGFFYAVWLYNSPTSFKAVSRAPNVGSNGSVQGGALLPKDASKYRTLLLTHETASRPSKPGPVVLTGAFALH